MIVKCQKCGKDLCFDESECCVYCGYPAPEDLVEVVRLHNDLYPDDILIDLEDK